LGSLIETSGLGKGQKKKGRTPKAVSKAKGVRKKKGGGSGGLRGATGALGDKKFSRGTSHKNAPIGKDDERGVKMQWL